MKIIRKIITGLVLATFAIVNVNAQPKSEIPKDESTKINWAGADTLYTFQFNAESNSWIYFQKEVRRFNVNGNPTENFVQIWQPQYKSWVNYLRVNYNYDERDNEIEEITQEWDATESNWKNAQLISTTYKGKHKEVVLFQQWKKPANEWFNIMKYLIQYNSNGDNNTVLISLYNGVSRKWDNHKKFVMEFIVPYGPPTTTVAETWTNNNWETDGKYEIAYNWRGDKTHETRYTWNQGQKSWIKGIMLEMIYDRDGNQTDYIDKRFDSKNKSWMNFNRLSATYNEKGYMTEKTEYKWNRETNQWDIKGQYKFTTDTKI